jgi:hypothetical protein
VLTWNTTADGSVRRIDESDFHERQSLRVFSGHMLLGRWVAGNERRVIDCGQLCGFPQRP